MYSNFFLNTPNLPEDGTAFFSESGDDDPECFLAERLSLNVGRRPGATQFWRRFQMVELT